MLHLAVGGKWLAVAQPPIDDMCTCDFVRQCQVCKEDRSDYNCSLPGLEDFTPGQYQGVSINYLSMVTEVSSPHFPVRAAEFEACTGGEIVISDASSIWEDPVNDLGSRTSRGSEVYDGYFMSYAHAPGFSAIGLAETLNERIRKDNARLQWEDVLPKPRKMGEYRKDGATNIDFLMYDGESFVPIIRLDLLEKHNIPLPNTWDELADLVNFFHGKDLNEDGEPDFGICHFPRFGHFDDLWWPAEMLYSTWATTQQTQGTEQGFFFDVETMEPLLSDGFRYSTELWKNLWEKGESSETDAFQEGRCAVGYGPPGSWKRIFLQGVSRKDVNGTVLWQPTMKSGEYAEPYRFKTFGSTRVVDSETGRLVACTPETCPKGEIVPPHGHHGDGDRASILPRSPLEGKIVNRAPMYWSGSLGTLIRKSSDPIKKDMMWDFMIYTNAPSTSVTDVASVSSWLDSWRYSQLAGGDNFHKGGWSEQAYKEHAAIQRWANSNEVNGAFGLRIPAVSRYTRDVLGSEIRKYANGFLDLDALVTNVTAGWNVINLQEGKLEQLQTYRASLGLDELSDVELCILHRNLMDRKDPSICRQYDPVSESNDVLLASIAIGLIIVVVAIAGFLFLDRRRLAAYKDRDDIGERDEIMEVEQLTRADNVRVAITRFLLVILLVLSGALVSRWQYRLLDDDVIDDSDLFGDNPQSLAYVNGAAFGIILILFMFYDWLVRSRNRKVSNFNACRN